MASLAPTSTLRSASGSGRSQRRRRPAPQGLRTRMARSMAHWPEALEAPVAQRRGELLVMCGCMLAGWAALTAAVLSTMG